MSTEPETDRPMTIKWELWSLRWICKRVLRLSPASQRWLRDWIDQEVL